MVLNCVANCCFARELNKETYKSISSTFASLTICDDHSFFDGAVDSEMFSKRFVRCVVRQAANEEFSPCGILLLNRRAIDGAGTAPQDTEAP